MRINRFIVSCLMVLCTSACEKEAEFTVNMDVPARPMEHVVIFAGDMQMDSAMDRVLSEKPGVRRNRIAVRKPIWGLFELLKGPNMVRNRSACVMSLGSRLGAGANAGDPMLAEMFHQADAEVVSIASRELAASSGAEIEKTISILDKYGAPVAGISAPGQGLKPVYLDLDGVTVGLIVLYVDDGKPGNSLLSHYSASDPGALISAVKAAADAARGSSDIVAVYAGYSRHTPPDSRMKVSRDMLEKGGVDVVAGHHDGAFEGIEVRNKGVIIHNTGPALLSRTSDKSPRSSLIVRLHVNKSGIKWIEAQPITLEKRKSRIGMGTDETWGVIRRLQKASEPFGTKISNEFGRGIIDL